MFNINVSVWWFNNSNVGVNIRHVKTFEYQPWNNTLIFVHRDNAETIIQNEDDIKKWKQCLGIENDSSPTTQNA